MLADQLIALGPQANRRFMLAGGLEGVRRGIVDAAKWARDLVRS
jgi:hypothetical protein